MVMPSRCVPKFTAAAGATYINSIQQVSITIAASSTSNTATISTVSSTAFIIFQGLTTTENSDSPNLYRCRVELTNPTTVTVSRNASDGNTITVNAVIIDAKSTLVTSVQNGTITITAGTSNTATIISVGTTGVVYWLGDTTSNTTAGSARNTGATLTDATTVTAQSGTSTTATVGYCAVQFASAAIKSIQQFSAAFTSNTAADTQTISAVTIANCMLAYGGINTTNGSWSGCEYREEITGTTTVTLTRSGTSTTARTPFYTVVEFVSGVLASGQRSNIILNNVTSNTATITSVNTSNAYCNFPGWLSAGTSGVDLPRAVFPKVSLTDATTVTATKNTGGALSSTTGYEVIQFN